MLLSTSAVKYSKEYSDTVHCLTYPSEKLMESVGTSVTLMESVMVEMAHLNSAEQNMAAAIKNSIDFELIRGTGCSLHQRIVVGIVRGLKRIYNPWWCKRTNILMTEAIRQRATKRKMKILAYQ
jgi:hypothetical protein